MWVAKIGYARCSSQGQDLTIQQHRLRKAGCTIIRSEKASGGSLSGRDELTSIMEFVREGDELVVLKLDRLGRNTRDVLNLVHELRQKGAILSVLEPRFSTTDVAGPILVTVLGMVAELERSFIRERQKAGIERAQGTEADSACRAGSSDAQGGCWAERHRERAGDQPDECASGATRSRVTPVDKMAHVGYSAAPHAERRGLGTRVSRIREAQTRFGESGARSWTQTSCNWRDSCWTAG